MREQAPDATLAVLSDHGQCEETHVVHVNGVLRDLGVVRLLRERPTEVGAAVAGDALRTTVRVPLALRRLRSNPILRPAARLAKRALRGGLRVELVTPEQGLEVDRVLSRAFTPTIASYAVYTRECDESELERIREALVWRSGSTTGARPSTACGRSRSCTAVSRRRRRPTFVYAPTLGVRPSIRVGSPFVERARQQGRGAHQRDGIVVLAGAEVVPGELGRPALYDLCPTLIWLMDLPIPADADGRVLFEAFTEEAAQARAARGGRHRCRPPGRQAKSSAEVEQRLRALGYL